MHEVVSAAARNELGGQRVGIETTVRVRPEAQP
jgi:hypothetical protein